VAGPPRSARDVHARVETDRATYRVGDTVAVRIALTNVGEAPVTFTQWAPWHIVRLVVSDEQGRLVAPAYPVYGEDAISTHRGTFAPGDTVVWTWKRQAWFDLRRWGYDLRAPGRYTIAGVPLVYGPDLAPDLDTVRSNRVTITVAP
jgi:hypothetical protein